jgi:DOPA 4,5-dioxygenase
MLNSEMARRLRNPPPGFHRDYDAHIYYTVETRATAEALQERVASELAGAPILIGELIDRGVGPHPLPMFELNFPKAEFERMLLWLIRNRGPLTVLVHEVTGHDLRDHSQGAIWLGPPVPLDESQLDPG